MMRWRSLIFSCFIVLLTLLGMLVSESRTSFAAEIVRIRLPEVTRARGQPVTMKVYQLAHQPGDWRRFQYQVAAMPPSLIQGYVKQEEMEPHTSVSGTTELQFAGEVGQTYLLVQQLKLRPFVILGWVQPLAVKVTNHIATLEAKGTTIQEKPYFYKVGVSISGTTQGLSGAQFVLTRKVAEQNQYLTADGNWSGSVKTAQQFISDVTGLIRYDGVSLPAGNYEFQEVKPPAGYRITDAAKHVTVHIPETGKITVQSTALEPLLAGQAPSMENVPQSARIFNDLDADSQGDKSKGSDSSLAIISQRNQPKRHGPLWLPQTGEAQAILAVIGGLMILIAIVILKHLRNTYTSNNKER
ncbi:LPXTG cell wall anchor domain-containing protein [Lactobacillus sp. LC28-10]|uniref:LPXTG cell wall anchor domain-containing protein n=1 Tax=Secundilactobacillus angelensis TaxID=2722706 RepID=A0ABX1KVM6_9LACO|nr:SpaA isopeptide-forming pilin-related protein [Secundilactobacillus angelensis]MCH5461687.1 LPXTG cell wall anchor domain-containing protein [Secundilactobacillus angelensis]NLR17983.1 LPXTG cell wall anchor domain-containing protein [Secundilactobacillus angelensis]